MFQSTFPRRERLTTAYLFITSSMFQSTFPRRERLLRAALQAAAYSFNPRSREGNDKIIDSKGNTSYGFQSTFPRRERQDNVQNTAATIRFQSTFPRRERRFLPQWSTDYACFNPRSREGNDCHSVEFPRYRSVSIHVPAKGTTSL